MKTKEEVLAMNREELLALHVDDFSNRHLSTEEVVHVAKAVGAFWTYDYDAAEAGKVGMHAILKSGRHSDGFFVSRILLGHDSIRQILSHALFCCLNEAGVLRPYYVAGIPDGATALGNDVADMFGAGKVTMEKVDGRITLRTPIPPHQTVLLVEDFCTRGTGFSEAVAEVSRTFPQAHILPYDPVILNRGSMKEIIVPGVGGPFKVLAIVEKRVEDWDPSVECPLCKLGSTAIKPKVSDENWSALIASQQ